jgi:hypothetical protein
MDIYKNAPLVPKSREATLSTSSDGCLFKAAVAANYITNKNNSCQSLYWSLWKRFSILAPLKNSSQTIRDWIATCEVDMVDSHQISWRPFHSWSHIEILRGTDRRLLQLLLFDSAG